jgi:hypothetical protein
MKYYSLLPIFFILSGCFISPDGDKTDPVEKPKISGLITLEDLGYRGETKGYLSARFYSKESSRKATLVRAERMGNFVLDRMNARAPQVKCSVEESSIQTEKDVSANPESISRNIRAADASSGYLSAGKLTLTPVNISGSMEISEKENHSYQWESPGALPDGYYEIAASGSDAVSAFRSLLSMPERFDEDRINGVSFSEKAAAIKKSEVVFFEWRAPVFSAEGNVLVAELLGATESALTTMQCLILERDIVANSQYLRWELPKVFVAQIPATTAARAYFSRAHVVGSGEGSNPSLTLQGIRTHALDLVIGE